MLLSSCSSSSKELFTIGFKRHTPYATCNVNETKFARRGFITFPAAGGHDSGNDGGGAAAVAAAAAAAAGGSKGNHRGSANDTDALLTRMLRAEQRHEKRSAAVVSSSSDPLRRLAAAAARGSGGSAAQQQVCAALLCSPCFTAPHTPPPPTTTNCLPLTSAKQLCAKTQIQLMIYPHMMMTHCCVRRRAVAWMPPRARRGEPSWLPFWLPTRVCQAAKTPQLQPQQLPALRPPWQLAGT